MANKGLLPRYKVLVWFRVEDEVATDGCITEQETLDKIERWIIESGGWPFCNTLPEEVEGNFWQKRLERHQNVVVDPEIQSEELFDRVLSPAAQLFPNGQNDDIYLTQFKNGSFLILDTSQGLHEIISLKPGEH